MHWLQDRHYVVDSSRYVKKRLHSKTNIQQIPSIEAQRSKYIEIRSANPTLRVRSDLNLGPRVKVDVTNTQRSTLEQPEEFFVSLEQYAIDNPAEAAKVTDADKVHEFMDGKWIEGVLEQLDFSKF